MSRRSNQSITATLLTLLLLAALPATASADDGLMRNPSADVQLRGGFENGRFSEFSGTSTSHGRITVRSDRAFRGNRSALVTSRNSSGFAYSRVQHNVNWAAGDEVWYGAAIYLEPGFNRAQGKGSTDIIRWDNWAEHPSNADHGGLAIRSDGRLVLISERMGVSGWTQLLGPYDMPEGRWVWLEVRQRFSTSNGLAINEVWRDGQRIGANTDANYFGRPITRHRVGLVGTPNPQAGELRMYIDEVTIARRGPVYQRGSSSTSSSSGRFVDAGTTFSRDIEQLAERGITRGCNPPANDRFCTRDDVTRAQMATMLVRAFDLPAGGASFRDTQGSIHVADISSLATARVTRGCNPPANDRFCPERSVTRGQMASFLARAAGLPSVRPSFGDARGHTHAGAIGAMEQAGITVGCGANRYCPDEPVTRGQMAAFLMRTLRHIGAA